mmetsp:Transcript_124398/g.359702  ORF Transcript_124398/g.359702 Transcript_124398/m.359702 type:complete len:108 (+) Transcript_124398:57-380(+)
MPRATHIAVFLCAALAHTGLGLVNVRGGKDTASASGVRPLSGSEKAAVGEALGHALGVMSGKEKSGDKFSICLSMFPDGPPADAATDAVWQSCKQVLPGMAAAAARR